MNNTASSLLPKISVVTVSFNQGEFIRDNIESVLAQQYPNFEHIIVDGGSTDSTLDVLRAYPHLLWTSEPDRGQTHALNKGFARATGDIIAWLNSDDWYPPGIFRQIAAELSHRPIVMGACQLTDRNGTPTEYVPNVARNWFDILKYWIFFSSPSQPSIFFRRSILEEFRRPDGTYLDEELNYTMDYEFWLRIAQRYPLNAWNDQLYSYYRNYESNKTGKDMPKVYREMARVYRRYCNSAAHAEVRMSYIIPLDGVTAPLMGTLESIATQELADLEVLFVDYSKAQDATSVLESHLAEHGARFRNLPIRFLRAPRATFAEAADIAARQCNGSLGAILEPGTRLTAHFTAQASNLFLQDIIGFALPAHGEARIAQELGKDDPNRSPGRTLNYDALFGIPPYRANFVFRKAAWLDLEPLRYTNSPLLSFRELLFRLLYKGWHINVENALHLSEAPYVLGGERDLMNQWNQFVNARLIVDTAEDLAGDPFAQLRAKNGFALTFPDALVGQCRELLTMVPSDWYRSKGE